MRKNKKHLRFYNRCIEGRDMWKFTKEGGISPLYGLCHAVDLGLIDEQTFDRFHPTEDDIKWLNWEGYSTAFWGLGKEDAEIMEFTPLRQTIVLFMAAIKGEL